MNPCAGIVYINSSFKKKSVSGGSLIRGKSVKEELKLDSKISLRYNLSFS